jgi:AcrR family transcriptional regulator
MSRRTTSRVRTQPLTLGAAQPDAQLKDGKPRAGLSRDRVLRTAVALADRKGIEAVTMRRLAKELGVEAMTLYHYVANKDEMLEGMVDLVAREVPLPDGGVDWKGITRRRAIATREVLRQHPWASNLWVQVGLGPGRSRYMDSALRVYREGGLSPDVTDRVYHAVENHIFGFTLQAQVFPLEEVDLKAVGMAFLQTLPPDYPYLAEHIVQHLEKGVIDDNDFEFGLDLILDGIERLAAEEKGSKRKARSRKRPPK